MFSQLLIVADFPLWHMGISGYEVMVMSTVSPFLLASPPLRSLVVKNLRVCHFLALTGLLAYQVHYPTYRLFTVGFAIWMSCLSWAATWYSEGFQPARLESKISAWTIGLVASSVVKFAWQTSNPIWPTSHAANGGLNEAGFVLAVLAVLRSTRQRPGNSSELALQGRQEGSSVLAALGFAGVLFGMHSLL